jgi:NAD(P)-dependent dehydrogenase (short-subunit alcohol dehydrogenase family)
VRSVLITGGGTGIGAAVTRSLAADGWQVAILGRRAAALRAVASETGALDVVCDVSIASEAKAAVALVNGHVGGVDAAYRAAVHVSDQRVGRLIAAARSRPAAETWTIVVVTDHGHVDEGGHGGREPEVITAWAAVSGADASCLTSQLDIAPLVARALGQ